MVPINIFTIMNEFHNIAILRYNFAKKYKKHTFEQAKLILMILAVCVLN